MLRRLALLLPALLMPSPGIHAQEAAEPAETPRISQAYLYIEPYLARFEFLMDLPTAFDWLNESSLQGDLVAQDLARKAADQAAALASTWIAVRADDLPIALDLPLASIVMGKPGATVPLEGDSALAPKDGMMGFVWEIPLGASPQSIQVSWRGFIEGLDSVDVRTVFGEFDESVTLVPSSNSFAWRNQDRLPEPEALAPIPPLPERETFRLPLGAIVIFGGGLFFFILLKVKRYHFPGGSMPYYTAWLLGSLLMLKLLVIPVPNPFGEPAETVDTPQQAQKIAEPLLRNVYRAFDQREEGAIYDTLARSVDGPLLKQLYLDVVDALTLEEAEGARVQVAEFAADVLETESRGDGFVATTSWSAMGSVGHWGHNHTRVNTYEAEVTVEPRNGEWRITAIEVTDQRRL